MCDSELLMFGRESRVRVDGVLPTFEPTTTTTTNTKTPSFSQFAADWQRRMNEAFQLAIFDGHFFQHYNSVML